MTTPKILGFISLQAAAFVGIGWGLWHLSGRPHSGFVTIGAWEIGYGVALAAVLIGLAIALTRLFPAASEWLVRSQAGNYPFLKGGISFPAIILISICAGLGEEALFRGGIQTLLGDYVSAPLAIIVAAALFAVIHFAKPVVSALIFAIGCVFGAVYLATGSLLAVIVAHSVYDVYAIWSLQEAMARLNLSDNAGEPG
ncbi:MAG: CPBP family intramembrane glutamic endopeptidase [Erythrobacter sp.]